MLSLFRALYRRAGPRYPKLVLLGLLPTAYLTALLGVAATALNVDVSLVEHLRLLLAACLLIWTVGVAFEARLGRGDSALRAARS
jgi:hypothetical protein